jgi:hypothetical protein
MNKKYDGNGSVREHLIFLSKLSIGIREQVRKFEEDLLVNIAVISLPKVCNTFKVNDNAKETLGIIKTRISTINKVKVRINRLLRIVAQVVGSAGWMVFISHL